MHTEREAAQFCDRGRVGGCSSGDGMVRRHVHLVGKRQYPVLCPKSYRSTHDGALCAPCRRRCQYAACTISTEAACQQQ
jgi:hypothetical protein